MASSGWPGKQPPPPSDPPPESSPLYPPPAGQPPPPSYTSSEQPRPVPVSQLVRPVGGGGGGGGKHGVVARPDGTATWENPSACCEPPMAACFYMPFPFFCMGCCIFRRASLLFDDSKSAVTMKQWKGHCHLFGCVKTTEVPYSNIGNFGYTSTSFSVGNGHHAGNFVKEPLLIERDGTVHRLGHYHTGDPALHAVVSMKRHVFDRSSTAPMPSPNTAEYVDPRSLPGECCGC